MTENPLDKLDAIEADVRALRTRAEHNGDPHTIAQCVRQLAEVDQIRQRITEAVSDADTCAALENQFNPERG